MTTMSLNLEAEHRLVTDAQQGDVQAAERIVRENSAWVRSVIYGVTGRVDRVDDIAQQVWMHVWERLPSLKDPKRLRSWLYSVARNAAIDSGIALTRRQSHVRSTAEAGEFAPAPASQDPLQIVLGNELQDTLLDAVRALPALYREPFVLRHLEGWTYSEIGEVLGLPVETVETRLVRARRLLKESLENRIEP